MPKPSTRVRSVSLVLFGVLAVMGCQGGSEDPSPTTVPVPTPTPAQADDVDVTTQAATTTETTTAATSDTSGDSEAPTSASTPAAAPSEDPSPTAEETIEETADDEPVAAGVVVVEESTVFTTPAQVAFCSLSAPAGGMASAVSCEVAQSSVPPGEELMGMCPSEGYGWYFNFFEDVGHGGFSCNHHDGIVHLSGVDLANDPWVDQSQVHVTSRGSRVPILGYGQVLRAGGLSCSVQPDGLTCSSADTGRGFTVNSGSYVSW